MKDLMLVSRDWLGLFFIVAFPVMMGIFFGSLYPDGSDDSGTNKLEVAVVDNDVSDQSAKFVQGLRDTGSIEVHSLVREDALDKVRRGQLVGVIILPRGYGETAGLFWREAPEIELGVDPSRQAEAGMLEGLIMQTSGTLMFDRFQNPTVLRALVETARIEIRNADQMPIAFRSSFDEMMNSLDGFLADVEGVQTQEDGNANSGAAVDNGFTIARIKEIDVTRRPAAGSKEELFSRIRTKWDISFPQAMLWGLLSSAATFAISIVRERKQGTFLRLQAAPVSRSHILLGKATACFFTVIGVITMMVVLGLFLGMRPRSPALLVVASICIAFCFVGITALMSVVGKTEEAVSGAAWGANMIIAMFGGGMIPLAFMPKFMSTLSVASPGRWSILALEGAIWRGFTPTEMLFPCGVLVAFGAVCLMLGSIRLMRVAD